MSMEDILKVLVNSRQQGTSTQAADPMTDLIGGLLGGGQSQGGVNLSDGVDAGDVVNLLGGLMGGAQQQQQQPQQPASGLSGMMGLLETVMGGQGGSAASDPMMNMLKPFVAPLAKKANISPEIAMIVVSFVAHKLLAHHPSSGRDSNTFNLDNMLGQIGSGKIDSNLLQSSGMVSELSKRTGLDEASAVRSLETGFSLVGKSMGLTNQNSNKPSAKPNVPTGQPVRTLGAKKGTKSGRN